MAMRASSSPERRFDLIGSIYIPAQRPFSARVVPRYLFDHKANEFWKSRTHPNVWEKQEDPTAHADLGVYWFSGSWKDHDILEVLGGRDRVILRLSQISYLLSESSRRKSEVHEAFTAWPRSSILSAFFFDAHDHTFQLSLAWNGTHLALRYLTPIRSMPKTMPYSGFGVISRMKFRERNTEIHVPPAIAWTE